MFNGRSESDANTRTPTLAYVQARYPVRLERRLGSPHAANVPKNRPKARCARIPTLNARSGPTLPSPSGTRVQAQALLSRQPSALRRPLPPPAPLRASSCPSSRRPRADPLSSFAPHRLAHRLVKPIAPSLGGASRSAASRRVVDGGGDHCRRLDAWLLSRYRSPWTVLAGP
jgi:hypothetical protein